MNFFQVINTLHRRRMIPSRSMKQFDLIGVSFNLKDSIHAFNLEKISHREKSTGMNENTVTIKMLSCILNSVKTIKL